MITFFHPFGAALPAALHAVVRRALPLIVLSFTLPVGAADYLWYGSDDVLGGDNTWDATSTYWLTGGGRSLWPNAAATTARAVFGGDLSAPFTVVVASGTTINANALWFQTNYTLNRGNSSSRLNFVGATPTITVDPGITVTTSVAINGTNVTLTGGGTWQLGASNRLNDSLGLLVDGGSTFSLNGRTETVGTVTLIAGSLVGGGTLTTTGSFDLLSGTVSATLAGANHALNKYGSGTVVLNSSSTYTGATTVAEGTLQLGAADRIANTSALNVTGGTFSLGSYSETVGAVTLASGSITGTTGTLTGDSYALQSGFVSARLGGTDHVLTKSTAGIVTLSGVNTYTGATTVGGGSLVLANTGSIATNSAVAVNAGATFAGSGTVTNRAPVTVNSGGHLSPGSMDPLSGVSSIGTLTTGAQTWNGGGAYDWQIGALTGTSGTNWDLVSLSGLTINATSTNKFILNVGNLGVTLPATGSYSWAIASLSSGTWGTIANLNSRFQVNLPTAWAADAYRFSITQDTANLYLTMAVPEPRTYALLLGVATLGFIGFRRWRQAHAAV